MVILTVAACAAPADPDETGEEPSSTVTSSIDVEPVRTVDWQGHRGARGLRPENTLPGFELALDLGVDTLELDLHLTADDRVVVWHDPLIEESKCGTDLAGTRVRELTADQLRSLDCRSNPDTGRFPDQKPDSGTLVGDDYGIVTLAELFAFVGNYQRSDAKTAEQRSNAATVRFNIETKRKPDDPAAIGDGFDGSRMGLFEQAVVDATLAANLVDRVTVQSFDHRSLWVLAEEYPELSLAALTRRNDRIDQDTLSGLIDRGAQIWSPDYRSLTADNVEAAHDLGLAVIPWTVNDPSEMAELLELGVDGIITDRPDLRPQDN